MTSVDIRIRELEEQVRQLRARLSVLTEELQTIRAKTAKTAEPQDRRD